MERQPPRSIRLLDQLRERIDTGPGRRFVGIIERVLPTDRPLWLQLEPRLDRRL